MIRSILTALALCAATAAPALDSEHVEDRMTGTVVDRDGNQIGSVSVSETASGIVLVRVTATPLPSGAHGIHLHEVGACEGDFSSAGGHIAGDAGHGLVEDGTHPGDMPNGFVEVEALNYEALNERIAFQDHLRDDDGAALIIHSSPDDYMTQPSGDAGGRIACAVLTDAPQTD